MKRAAIVTLFHNNYNFGGQLQAYALQTVITSYGIECDIIDYNPQNKYKKMKALSYKTIISRFYHKFQMKFHQMLNSQLKSDFDRKGMLFQVFMNNMQHTKEIHNKDISTIAADYEYWITGSDQVWNPEAFTGSPLYLLKGVSGKKFSYAASSKNAKYDSRQKEELKNALESFSAVSVREKGLEKAIADISGKTVTTVSDPTLLLSSREWDSIAVEPSIKEKYAFVYLIHISNEVRRNIFNYCRKHKLKMVIVPHAQGWYKSADEKFYDIQAAAIGPAEWIGYIKNADVVFTDSFHGTVFSVNYHKQFVSFENVTGNPQIDNGLRKYSVLKQLGLLARCVPYSHDLDSGIISSKIDYIRVDERLNMLRKQSRGFLEKALDVRK